MADRCPCCGTLREIAYDPLVAACDVLVLRALELVGKRLVRVERARFAELAGRPFYEAHRLWPARTSPDPEAHTRAIEKALDGVWGAVSPVLSEHGCCGATPEQVETILDRYVRDLLATGHQHDVDELRFRLGAYLGVPA